jgi:hypothetical protein
MHEEHQIGRKHYYIRGGNGRYVINACGNNRCVSPEFATVEEARAWLYS